MAESHRHAHLTCSAGCQASTSLERAPVPTPFWRWQACLFSATSPAARNSVLQQVAAASRQWLGSREAREAGHLQPLWPPALAAVLDLALRSVLTALEECLAGH